MIINIRRGRAASEGITTSSGPARWMRGRGIRGKLGLAGNLQSGVQL